MSQIVYFQIDVKEIICTMKDSLNSLYYMYNINILDSGNCFESQMSNSFKNDFLNLPIYPFDSDESSKYSNNSGSKSFFEKKKISKRKESAGTIIFPVKKKIQVNKDNQEFTEYQLKDKYSTLKNESKKKFVEILSDHQINKKLKWQDQNLEINYLVNVSHFRSINLQICLWKKNKMNNFEGHYLFAECYVFLQNLFNQTQKEIKDKSVKKIIKYSSDLFINGEINGHIQIRLNVDHKIYLEQSLVGIMSEKGLLKFNPFIENRINKFNKNLNELDLLLKDFEEKFTLQNLKEENNSKKIEKSISHSKYFISSLLKILRIYENYQMRMFNYKSINDLLKAQNLFLQIGNLLLDFYERLDIFSDEEYYQCLEAILIRGEFSIHNIGFHGNINKKQLDSKREIGIIYQKFIYSILKIVSNEINQKGILTHQRHFIEFFLSYSFFRIPEFRQNILEIFENDIYEDESVIKNSLNSNLYDWKNEFYVHLETCFNYNSNTDILLKALDKNWKDKFINSNMFFYFIFEWTNYIKKNLFFKNFNLENIYGYKTIEKKYKSFIIEKNINMISNIAISAGNCLLENNHNLNDFMLIIINKTNLWEQRQVLSCFGILKKWFDPYLNKNQILPSNLDVHLLIHMTLIMFNTMHGLGITHALNFWLEYFIVFPKEILKNFIALLVDFYLYDILLHWSKNVRDIFVLLICYRLIPFYHKGDGDDKNFLKRIFYFINKGFTIIQLSGEIYKLEITKFNIKTKKEKRKNTFNKLQSGIIKKINEITNHIDFQINDFLKIEGIDDFNIIRRERKYSSNLLDFETGEMLISLKEEDDKIRKFRNYNDLVNFEKIKKSKLKKKHLIYCLNIIFEFKKNLQKYKKEEKNVLENSRAIPVMNVQLVLDTFEYIDDEIETEWS